LILLKKGSIFLESYTNYDLTVLEEFESLFPSKVQELITPWQVSPTRRNGSCRKIKLNTKLKTWRTKAETFKRKEELEALVKIAEQEAKAKQKEEALKENRFHWKTS
jgi:hypothetical protein